MPKSQQYLIGLLVSILLFSVFVFRSDLFILANRPGLTSVLQGYVVKWGIALAFVLFGYFLAKLFRIKWIYPILVLIFIELTYIILLNFSPNWLNDSAKLNPWFIHLKRIALENRSMVQFEEDCAQYDQELFYTLKPGLSDFKSFEFKTALNVNSKGYRDQEEDLVNPEVIFMGDSFTMGWGIEQDSTFESVFQQKSGLKTLNMGISSYGTAREYRSLQRVNLDSLKLLVIQFHDTDLEENHHFVSNGKLGNQTKEDFNNQVKYNASVVRYYPFKYIKSAIIDLIINDFFPKPGSNQKLQLGGDYLRFKDYQKEFFEIIKMIRIRYKGPVMVTYAGSFLTNPLIIENLKDYAVKNKIEEVYFLNMAEHLSHVEYFFLDDHLNNKGHRKIADQIYNWFKIK